MPVSRTRYQQTGYPQTGAYFNRYVGTSYRTTNRRKDKTTTDTVGNFPNPNGFHSTLFESHFPTMTGQKWVVVNGQPVLDRQVLNWPITHVITSTGLGYGGVGLQEASDFANQIKAGTNPNVPHIAIPTAIGELKDLKDVPRRVRQLGQNRLKDVADGYISWRWAVRPMVNDVRALLSFQKAVNNRLGYLENLRVKKSLKRRTGLGSSSTTTPLTDVFVESQVAIWKAKRTQIDTVSRWGSAQWKLEEGYQLPARGSSEEADLAYKLTFGITSEQALATLWELTPWSWLVDWFTGVGDAIAASSNHIPVTSANLCLMTQSERVIIYTPYPASAADTWAKVQGKYQFRTVIKHRQVVVPTSPFQARFVNMLNTNQLSILAALSISKAASR